MEGDSKWQQMAAKFHLLPYLKPLCFSALCPIMAAVEAKNEKLFPYFTKCTYYSNTLE